MKAKLFHILATALWFAAISFGIAQDKTILVVKPKANGSKGTLCELFDHSGNETGSNVIVRDFFASRDQFTQLLTVSVTTSDEKMMIRKVETPIFYLIPNTKPTPFDKDKPNPKAILAQGTTVKTTKDQFFIIDEKAALLFPANWSVTENLTAPLFLASEQTKLQIGLSLIKEDPDELEVESLSDYADLKIELMKDRFPDFSPSLPKAGNIGGLPAMFFQGPGTVEKIKGTIICMAIEGSDSNYLLFGITAISSPPKANAELLKVMKSFKEKK